MCFDYQLFLFLSLKFCVFISGLFCSGNQCLFVNFSCVQIVVLNLRLRYTI